MIRTIDASVGTVKPIVPPEVEEFAAAKGITEYLDAVIELAREAFPVSALHLSVGQDAEDETHQYIALDVDVADLASDELLAGQRIWSAGLSGVCPTLCAVYFVLGWR